MFKFFKKNNKQAKAFNKDIAENELQKNVVVIKSLRDYDQGKKDISTTNIERRLPNIRVTTGA